MSIQRWDDFGIQQECQYTEGTKVSIIPRRVIALHDFDLWRTLRMYDRIGRYVSYINFLPKKICVLENIIVQI